MENMGLFMVVYPYAYWCLKKLVYDSYFKAR